jgi:hypothetical protein
MKIGAIDLLENEKLRTKLHTHKKDFKELILVTKIKTSLHYYRKRQ